LADTVTFPAVFPELLKRPGVLVDADASAPKLNLILASFRGPVGIFAGISPASKDPKIEPERDFRLEESVAMVRPSNVVAFNEIFAVAVFKAISGPRAPPCKLALKVAVLVLGKLVYSV
jgi:hypothetical protein